MTFSEEQVEWIVTEVMRRLRTLDGNNRVAGDERSSSPVDRRSELTLGDRVITLRSIENRLTDVHRLIITKQAVITPAVKDELKQRNIELVREARP
jgi:hypothetical protein